MKSVLYLPPSLLQSEHPLLKAVSETYEVRPLASRFSYEAGALYLEAAWQLSFLAALPHRPVERITLFFHRCEEALHYLQHNRDPHMQLVAEITAYGEALAQGELIAFPTETVYGLGGDATNVEAVGKIFAVKERPLHDPLIVHVANLEQLAGVTAPLDARAMKLIEHFWPGPLTLVVPKDPALDPLVTAGGSTVAIRMPANPLALSLIAASGKPIAAPSANRFGYTSPTTAAHVIEQLGERIDGTLDGGSCTVGIDSTVLSLATEVPTILRPGKITQAELEPIIGAVTHSTEEQREAVESPGMLASHYAPTTPFFLVDDVGAYADDSEVGILLYGEVATVFSGPTRSISTRGNLSEAASRLYWAMRELDSLGLKKIVCTLLPEEGIGAAINNRLRKAAARR